MGRVRLRVAAWRFARRWAGEYLVQNGRFGVNESGAQCVNVLNTFWERLGAPNISGDASAFIAAHVPGLVFHWSNSGGRPQAGDGLVMRPGGMYPRGHVALVLNGVGPDVVVLEQNEPLGAPCERGRLPRAQAVGWVRIAHH